MSEPKEVGGGPVMCLGGFPGLMNAPLEPGDGLQEQVCAPPGSEGQAMK